MLAGLGELYALQPMNPRPIANRFFCQRGKVCNHRAQVHVETSQANDGQTGKSSGDTQDSFVGIRYLFRFAFPGLFEHPPGYAIT